uniref:hypothetical protein n=1 Tax=Gelidibacter sp. TaxID=2018083 RepID=UPI00404B2F29
MKTKGKTYLLLAAVLGIWGIIGYKIISAFNPEIPEVAPQEVSVAFNPKPQTAIDTFTVQLVDRDPFLGTLQTKDKNTIPSNYRAVPKDTLWPQIRYGGMVKRQNTAEQIFVITINNQEHLVKKGQSVEEVKLLQGTAKNITVRYKNKQKVITIH